MSIEVNTDKAVCCKCGIAYGRKKGYFPVSYAELYKGTGYMPICKDCVEKMYNRYLSQCNDTKTAVRQMCRKLDLFWDEGVFEYTMKKSSTRSVMTQYIVKVNSVTYAGKSYDDTLSADGSLWSFGNNTPPIVPEQAPPERVKAHDEPENDDLEDIDDSVIAFWGTGYSAEMYRELEQKRQYWTSRFPEGAVLDVGTEAIIKQICGLELDISRDRAAGRPVDKSVGALNNLLGSANMKPAQKKDDADSALESTPFGIWIRRWENERPIPEADPEMKDADGIIKYVLTWFYGHLTKMLGIKNARSKLYEDEIERLRVDRPEYEDEDDETMIGDIFGTSGDAEESEAGNDT